MFDGVEDGDREGEKPAGGVAVDDDDAVDEDDDDREGDDAREGDGFRKGAEHGRCAPADVAEEEGEDGGEAGGVKPGGCEAADAADEEDEGGGEAGGAKPVGCEPPDVADEEAEVDGDAGGVKPGGCEAADPADEEDEGSIGWVGGAQAIGMAGIGLGSEPFATLGPRATPAREPDTNAEGCAGERPGSIVPSLELPEPADVEVEPLACPRAATGGVAGTWYMDSKGASVASSWSWPGNDACRGLRPRILLNFAQNFDGRIGACGPPKGRGGGLAS